MNKRREGMAKRRVRNWQEIEQSGGLATVPEVAEFLRISVPSVYALIKRSALPAIKVGDLTTRIRPADVNAMVEAGCECWKTSFGRWSPRKRLTVISAAKGLTGGN
jgi:excisionase family DNA binding protein